MRHTGIPIIGDVPWGTHFCQFYQDRQDLIELLVPYFKAGLENNEFCMWITSDPLCAEAAAAALARDVDGLDQYLRKGQIEILDYSRWYTLGGSFDSGRVLQGWIEKLDAARARGFAGLRLTGNTFWLEKSGWQDFTEYEAAVDRVIGCYPMLALCTYSLARCGAAEIMDVVANHAFALVKRAGEWQTVQSAERRRIEASLRESDARRARIAEAAPGALFDFMPDPGGGRFLYLSPRASEIFELDAAALVADTDLFWNLVHPEDRATLRQAAAAGQGETSFRAEARIVTPSGGTRWIEFHARRDAAGPGASVPWSGFILDITSRKRTEETLRRQAALIDLTPDGITVRKLDGSITFWSRGAESLYGWTAEEAAGRRGQDLLQTEYPQPLGEILDELMRTGRWSGELVHRARDGRKILVESSWLAQFDESGAPREIFQSDVDITVRKQKGEKLRRLNRALTARARTDQALLHAADETAYLRAVCSILVEECGHAMVWASFAEDDEARTVRPVAWCGFEDGYLETLGATWADTERGRGPTGTAIRTGKICVCANMLTDPLFAPWREEALRRGYASSLALPLLEGQRAFGALTMYSTESEPFSTDEIALLAELAGDFAHGIGVLRLRAAHAAAGKALRTAWIETRQHAAELDAMFEAISDAILFYDAEGRLRKGNAAAVSLFGPGGEWGGEARLQRLDGSPMPPHEAPLRRTLAGETVRGQTFRVITPEGREAVVEATAARVESDGLNYGAVIVHRDVTKRKRREEAIRSAALFPAENPSPVLRLARGGRLLFSNRSAVPLLAEWGCTAGRGVPPFVREAVDCALAESASRELVIHSGEREISFQVTPVAGHDYANLYGRDITESRRAERALRESEALLRAICDTTADYVFLKDREGRYLLANPAAVGMLGRPAAAVIGRTDLELWPDPSVAAAIAADDRRVMERGTAELIEETVPGPDGGRILLTTKAPWRDAEGRVIGLVGIARDITARKRAEEALRQASDQRRLALEAAELGAWDFRFDTGEVFWDERCRTMFGVTGGERMAYPDAIARIHPDDRGPTVAAVEAVLAGAHGGAYHREFRVVWPDGSEHWVSSHGRVHFEDVGGARRPVRFLGVNLDITAHKRADEALRESEARLNVVIENSPDSAFMQDRELRYVWVSRTFLPAGPQVLAETGYDLMERGDPARMADIKRSVLDEGARATAEFTLNIGGEERSFENTYGPWRDAAGRVIGVLGYSREITGRRRAEQALRESQERLSLAIASTGLGTWDFDPRTGKLFWSTATRLHFGLLSPVEVDYNTFLRGMHPDDRDRANQAVEQALQPEGGGEFSIEYRTVGIEDGRERSIAAWGRAFFDAQQRPHRFIGVTLDNTERKRVEEQLRHAQKLESIGLLAGGIAHDFNNLLVGIIGNASLAADILPPASPTVEILHNIVKSGEDAAHLTRQMLAYAGKGRFLLEPVDLSGLVRQGVGMIRSAISKKITVQVHVKADIASVETDPSQMQQVFMNLALNAGEAIGDRLGVITIATGETTVDQDYLTERLEGWDIKPGRYVFLEVRDTGCGMDAATRDKIFDPFFTTKFTGRGLGLAAVAGIVRAHRGAIQVTTAPGAGAAFRVLLPAMKTEVRAIPRPVERKDDLRGKGRSCWWTTSRRYATWRAASWSGKATRCWWRKTVRRPSGWWSRKWTASGWWFWT